MGEIEPALIQGINLCDYVLREQGTGKCTLLGTFHGFASPTFPSPPRNFWVNVALTNLHGPMKEMTITCRVEASDSGLVIANVSGKMAPTPGVDPSKLMLSPLMAIDIPIPFFNVVIPSPGVYVIAILVNGDKVGERRVEAIAMPPTGTQVKMG